jgi:hypothetical protein
MRDWQTDAEKIKGAFGIVRDLAQVAKKGWSADMVLKAPPPSAAPPAPPVKKLLKPLDPRSIRQPGRFGAKKPYGDGRPPWRR